MYFDSDMSKLMQRYVGRQVTVQTHGYSRIIGFLASVHESCIRLRNVVRLHELEDSRWYGEIERQQQEEMETGDAETLIATHAITCVSCSEYPGEPEEDHPSVDDALEDAREVNVEHTVSDDNVAISNLLVGAGLTALLANDRSDLERVKKLRGEIRSELGFTIPKVRVRDDFSLPAAGYRFVIGGVDCASGEVQPGKLLAIKQGNATLPEGAEPTVEPVFGLDAGWISMPLKEAAEQLGCVTVDCWTVIITHMGEAIRRNASSLLSYEETARQLQLLRESFPSLVNDHFTDPDSVLRLHRLSCELLDDGLTLKNSERIATAVAQAKRMKEEQAFSHVRRAVLAQMQASAMDEEQKITAVCVSSESQQRLAADQITVSQSEAERLCQEIVQQAKPVFAREGRLLVVVDPTVFPIARRSLSPATHKCLVVSSVEIRAMRGVTFGRMLGVSQDEALDDPSDGSFGVRDEKQHQREQPPAGGLAKPR